jgi:regulatory protein
MTSSRNNAGAYPLDSERLESLALRYAARYATSEARLTAYLRRKISERGWSGETPADVPALVARLADLRYVDDEAYARMKSDAMQRRGLGPARIRETLRHDGIRPDNGEAAFQMDALERWSAAERLARRKRIGPFAREAADPPTRQKHIAAFMRAGHDMMTARAWASAAPGSPPPSPLEDDA